MISLPLGLHNHFYLPLTILVNFNTKSINILSWNSRGLALSVPYIQSLLCEKPSVLVLSEHWLWRNKLARLNDISDNYEAPGKADSSLTETSNGGRCFWRIAILWHKTIGAIPVTLPLTVTVWFIFVIQMTIDPTVSVIGVYLPCSDQGMDCYRDHLQEFESHQWLCPSWTCHHFRWFQAHLDSLGGVRVCKTQLWICLITFL